MMIDPAQIPDEVAAAADAAYYDTAADTKWSDEHLMKTAIAAALNAWAGAEVVGWYHADRTLILPLPTEARDGE